MVAIKATNNKEQNIKIIKYLESLGGINGYYLNGNSDNNQYYYIDDYNFIRCFHTYPEHCKLITMNRNINLSLEEAKKLYKEGGEDIRKLILTTFTKEELEEFPISWKECVKQYKSLYYHDLNCEIVSCNTNTTSVDRLANCFTTKELANKIIAFEKLLLCRDTWRGDWIPKAGENKFIIYTYLNSCNKISYKITRSFIISPFCFETKELAEKFLETFKDLFIEAGDLIY